MNSHRFCVVRLLLLALPALLTPAQGGPAQGPRLEVVERIHDYGVLYHGEAASVSHTFILTNVGDETLVITGTHTSCGCTRADLSNQLIEPGGLATLVAELAFEEYAGRDQIRVTVTSNDPDNPSVDLGLQGFVIRRWALEPKALDAGVLPASEESGTGAIKVVSQRRMDEPEPILLAVEHDPTRVLVTSVGETDRVMQNRYREKTWHYQVQVRAGNEFSENESETIRFRTDCSHEPELTVSVRWKVEVDLEVAPRRLSLLKPKHFNIARTSQEPGAASSPDVGRVRIRSRPGNPVEITHHSIAAPLESRVIPGETPDVVWVETSIGTEDPGFYSGVLTLMTNHPIERQFDILVQAEVQPQKPILGVAPDFHHFGKVFADQIPEGTQVFSIRNSGARPLVVSLEPNPNLAAALGAETIPPGSSTTLVVRKSLAGIVGPVEEVLVLTSNDVDRPRAEIALRGEVLPRWRLEPDELVFPNSVQGREEIGRVRLEEWYSSWERPNEPVPFTLSDPKVQIEVGDMDQSYSGLGYATAETEIVVRLDPQGRIGWNERSVDLRVSRESAHPLPPLRLKWELLGTLRSLPRRLVFARSDAASGTGLTKQVKVYTLDSAAFEVREVRPPDGISVRPLEAAANEAFFEARVEDFSRLSSTAAIEFTTNLPDEPVYSIEVLVR